MKKFLFLVVIATMLLTACAPAAKPTEAAAANPGLQMDSAKVAPQFFTDAAFAESQDLMTKQALNPNDPIYLQYLVSNPTNISTRELPCSPWRGLRDFCKDCHHPHRSDVNLIR
jgi:hypothetical protein